MANFRKYRLLSKVITILIISSFLSSNIVYAQGSLGVHKEIAPILLNLNITTPLHNLQIPENLGKIKELWQSGASKTILHIQDSHANYEAQTNIAKILEYLINEYRPEGDKEIRKHYKSNGNNSHQITTNTPPILIALEGAKEGIDTSMFHKIPIIEIRDMLADYFMEKGIINGTEYFDAMTRDRYKNPPFLVWGVEDKGTYIRNVEYFKKVHETKTPVQVYVKEYIQNIKQKVENSWNNEQKEYFDKYYKYQNDDIGLEEYAIYLNLNENGTVPLKRRGLSHFHNLINLIKLKNKINFSKIEEERMEVLKQLKNKMVQEDFTDLITVGLHYQVGNTATIDYFSKLKKLMAEYNISKAIYKNLTLYFHYIEVEGTIDRKALFEEIRKIEHKIANYLFSDRESRTIFNEIYKLIILKKFTELKIYREDLRYYKEHKNEFCEIERPGLAGVGREGRALNIFLQAFEHFCNLGIKRDHILVENMLKKMDELGTDKAILITGGFHTDGMTEILKDSAINYAVISPKMLESGDKSKYIQLMLDKKSILEKILAFTGTRLAIASSLYKNLKDNLADTDTKKELERKIYELKNLLGIKEEIEDLVKKHAGVISETEKILTKIVPQSFIKDFKLKDISYNKENGKDIVIELTREGNNIVIGPREVITERYKDRIIEGKIEHLSKGGITIAEVRSFKGDLKKEVLKYADEILIKDGNPFGGYELIFGEGIEDIIKTKEFINKLGWLILGHREGLKSEREYSFEVYKDWPTILWSDYVERKGLYNMPHHEGEKIIPPQLPKNAYIIGPLIKGAKRKAIGLDQYPFSIIVHSHPLLVTVRERKKFIRGIPSTLCPSRGDVLAGNGRGIIVTGTKTAGFFMNYFDLPKRYRYECVGWEDGKLLIEIEDTEKDIHYLPDSEEHMRIVEECFRSGQFKIYQIVFEGEKCIGTKPMLFDEFLELHRRLSQDKEICRKVREEILGQDKTGGARKRISGMLKDKLDTSDKQKLGEYAETVLKKEEVIKEFIKITESITGEIEYKLIRYGEEDKIKDGRRIKDIFENNGIKEGYNLQYNNITYIFVETGDALLHEKLEVFWEGRLKDKDLSGFSLDQASHILAWSSQIILSSSVIPSIHDADFKFIKDQLDEIVNNKDDLLKIISADRTRHHDLIKGLLDPEEILLKKKIIPFETSVQEYAKRLVSAVIPISEKEEIQKITTDIEEIFEDSKISGIFDKGNYNSFAIKYRNNIDKAKKALIEDIKKGDYSSVCDKLYKLLADIEEKDTKKKVYKVIILIKEYEIGKLMADREINLKVLSGKFRSIAHCYRRIDDTDNALRNLEAGYSCNMELLEQAIGNGGGILLTHLEA